MKSHSPLICGISPASLLWSTPSFGPPIKTLPISRILRHRLDWMGAFLLKNLCVDFKRTNLILDGSFFLIPYDSQIKLRLEIKPKIGSRSERISEPKSHLRRDTALLLNDIVDAWSRNVESQCLKSFRRAGCRMFTNLRTFSSWKSLSVSEHPH